MVEAGLNGLAHADLLRVRAGMQAVALASDQATMRDLRPVVEDALAAADDELAQMSARYRDEPAELRLTLAQQASLARLVRLWRSRVLERTDARSRRVGFERVNRLWSPLERAAAALARREVPRAEEALEQAHHSYVRSRNLVAAAVAATLALGIAFAFWLTRTVVPRTRRYSEFARDVSEGQLAERVHVSGSDELAELGRTLNARVAERERERDYAATQAEFTDVLQVGASEEEAHTMLQIHLERSIAEGSVAVLNRNNSADRLELKTPVLEASPLPAAVADAEPRSCLAVRFARAHREPQ